MFSGALTGQLLHIMKAVTCHLRIFRGGSDRILAFVGKCLQAEASMMADCNLSAFTEALMIAISKTGKSVAPSQELHAERE